MNRGMFVVRGALSIRLIASCCAVVAALVVFSLLSSGVMSERSPTAYLLFAYFIIALKVPVNLAVFCATLLVVSTVRGTKVGALQESKASYVWSVVLTVLVASTVGAFADLLFSYSAYNVVILPGVDSESDRLAVATALILLSALASSHFLVGLRLESNVCTSAALAIATPAMWQFGYPFDVGVDGAAGVIMLGSVLSISTLGFLAAWYETEYAKGPAARPRFPQRAVFRASLGYFCAIAIAFALSTAVWGIRSESHSVPYTTLTKYYDTWTDSWEFTAGAVDPEEVQWNDVAVVLTLTDSGSSVHWANLSTSDLTSTASVVQDLGTLNLGGLDVSLTVLDLAGNGLISQGDRLIIDSEGFPEDVRFTIKLIYEPTDLPIAQIDFER
ncbi:MAG: hypothetical protein AB1793_04235 [Candidatus Thermoplasmatota archaeon]